MKADLSRRAWLSATAATGLALASRADAKPDDKSPFVYCLNTSTIRGQNLGIAQEVEIAARAGYGAIEPWINELDKFVTRKLVEESPVRGQR